uniref:PLCXc domain-containing protein n=1 Tax=Macrostomum lignano TaxID=282301 RepID=A0A1I8F4A1_9PLAT
YSSDGDYLSTQKKCSEIINQFEPSTEGRAKGQLGIDGPIKRKSSVEGYEKALKSQVRYIELEVWNGPNDEPIIYHGHTLTSKIGLRDVLDTPGQQCRMVQLIRSTLGDWLLDPGSASESDVQTAVGSSAVDAASRLRRRILVKCKKLPPPPEVAFGYVSEEDDNVDIQRDRSPKAFKRLEISPAVLLQQHSSSSSSSRRRLSSSSAAGDQAEPGAVRSGSSGLRAFADFDDAASIFIKSGLGAGGLPSSAIITTLQQHSSSNKRFVNQPSRPHSVWRPSRTWTARPNDGVQPATCLVPSAAQQHPGGDIPTASCTELNRASLSKNGYLAAFVLSRAPYAARTFAFLAQRGGWRLVHWRRTASKIRCSPVLIPELRSAQLCVTACMHTAAPLLHVSRFCQVRSRLHDPSAACPVDGLDGVHRPALLVLSRPTLRSDSAYNPQDILAGPPAWST